MGELLAAIHAQRACRRFDPDGKVPDSDVEQMLGIGGAIATTFVGPIEDRGTLSLVLIVATVAIAIAYVHWIDAPFERWRQRRATLASRTSIRTADLAPALERGQAPVRF